MPQEQVLKLGATMIVCGGNECVHGFRIDELVTIEKVRPEPELSHVALVKSKSRNWSSIMLSEELEELC